MIQFNRALLGKWLWQFAMEMDAFWKKAVEIKYGSMRGGWCSKEVGGPFAHHVKYEVGDGSKVLY
jgi:hypothetical protein